MTRITFHLPVFRLSPHMGSHVVLSILLFAVCASGSLTELRQTAVTYSPAVLGRLSPRTLAYVIAQPEIDRANDEYTPKLSSPIVELVPELGVVILGKQLGRSAFGTVFELHSHRDFVIKYQSNCDLLDKSVHPLLMDYWLAVEAARFNISAKPIFLSPPAAMSRSFGQKVDFRLPPYEWHDCAARGGTVRFMVMERLGWCMNSLPPTPNLKQGVLVGLHAMKLLHSLHTDAGIFHGDMHLGNICESRTEPGTLRLIDFGCGGFIDAESDTPSLFRMAMHTALTEWQILGHSYSRRDDIYKTMEIIGEVAVGESLWEMPRRWAKTDPDRLLEWKRTGNLFASPKYSAIGDQQHLFLNIRRHINFLLNRVVNEARRLTTVSAVIDYQLIFDDLLEVNQILNDGFITLRTTVRPTPLVNPGMAETHSVVRTSVSPESPPTTKPPPAMNTVRATTMTTRTSRRPPDSTTVRTTTHPPTTQAPTTTPRRTRIITTSSTTQMMQTTIRPTPEIEPEAKAATIPWITDGALRWLASFTSWTDVMRTPEPTAPVERGGRRQGPLTTTTTQPPSLFARFLPLPCPRRRSTK